MKMIHGVFAGCLLALPFAVLAQDNAQGGAQPMAAPAAEQSAPASDAAPDTTSAQPSQMQDQTQEQAQQQKQEQTQTQEQSQAQTQERTGFSRGSVAREAFTTQIKNREPANQLNTLNNDVHTVYFFTDLRDLKGQTVTHRWEYNGKVMAEVHFKVGGPRWRVWSSKNLEPGWTGEWKVSVVNGAGQVISEDTLDYKPAPAKPAAAQSGDQSHQSQGSSSMPMQNGEGQGGDMSGHGGMSDQQPMSGHDAMPSKDAMPAQGK